eukprot:scaffold10084_cov139-Isochrysis_galbana.AAC.13
MAAHGPRALARAHGGGCRPHGGRPGRVSASHRAGSTLPGGTAAQRARCADLGGGAASALALAPRAPRGPVGVGAGRGPGAMLSRRPARQGDLSVRGRVDAAARSERPADRVIPACGASAL